MHGRLVASRKHDYSAKFSRHATVTAVTHRTWFQCIILVANAIILPGAPLFGS